MAPKGGLNATWALEPRDRPILVGANFDSPPHFTPTLGDPDPLGAFVPHPNGQKGLKTPKGPKMAQNDQKMASKGDLDATWAFETGQF